MTQVVVMESISHIFFFKLLSKSKKLGSPDVVLSLAWFILYGYLSQALKQFDNS